MSCARWAIVLASGTALLVGCGGAKTVVPKAVGFAPTLDGCAGQRAECTSGNVLRLEELRRAHGKRCPEEQPYVFVQADGSLRCVASLPWALSPDSLSRAVNVQGSANVAAFKAGEAVFVTSGCLACHRLAGEGNEGPGPDLTQVGSRAPAQAIARALVKSPSPMPSFSGLSEPQRRVLVYFLAQLR